MDSPGKMWEVEVPSMLPGDLVIRVSYHGEWRRGVVDVPFFPDVAALTRAIRGSVAAHLDVLRYAEPEGKIIEQAASNITQAALLAIDGRGRKRAGAAVERDHLRTLVEVVRGWPL